MALNPVQQDFVPDRIKGSEFRVLLDGESIAGCVV